MPRPKPFNHTMPNILASASKPENNFHLVLNVSDDTEEEAELLIFDRIGAGFFSDGITATDVATFLSENKTRDINVRINSPGGSVFDGITIFNALAQHEAKVVTTVEGIAASAAALIATVGDVVRMHENTTFMIHRALTIAMGNVADMLDVADFLGKIDGQIRDILAAKSGLSQAEVMEFMIGNVDGTTFTAAEAFEKGFADEVIPLKQKKDKDESSQNANNTRYSKTINPAKDLKEGETATVVFQPDSQEAVWAITEGDPQVATVEDKAEMDELSKEFIRLTNHAAFENETLKRLADIRLDEIAGH